MSTVLYVIDQKHHDYLISQLTKVHVGPKFYWAAAVAASTDPFYDFLLPLVERIESEQDINTPKVEVPEGKIVVGVGCSWYAEGVIKGMDCDLFSPHELIKTPFQTIIGQVYRIADAILTDKQRPKKQIGLGWQYEQTSEGYYALRLRGLHE